MKMKTENSPIRLSEVADSIRYIPLETSDSCLVGSVDKMLRTAKGEYILVDQEKSRAIYVFDAAGHFLNRIGKCGKGPAEYSMIEDVTYGFDAVYVWDNVQDKILKYHTDGTWIASFPFRCTAYSFCCLGKDRFAFGCDYARNPSFYQEGHYPNVLFYDAMNHQTQPYLYFDEKVNNAAYTLTLNNLTQSTLRLPLNDTLYAVNSDGVFPQVLLQYDEKLKQQKQAYLASTRAETLTAVEADQALQAGSFPQLISYSSSQEVSLLFLRMGSYLYFGFFYPHSGTYLEGAAAGAFPVENDMDGSFFFIPLYQDGNRAYCLIDPSRLPDGHRCPLPLDIEDNPVIAEVYLKVR